MSRRFFDRWLRRSPRAAAASLETIRQSFNEAARDEEHFPSTIDPRIYHVQLLLKYFGDLGGKRVLDIGSGKGRFARAILDVHSSAKICCFDLAEAMLRRIPSGIERCCGSMTSLPFASGVADAAYATESLEHAVDIETAVAEICRVVVPGGRIVIIDKNAEKWGSLKTPAWERWFKRAELENLLRRHCRHVDSEFISYWEDVPPDGLFLAWKAEK
jgi:ubiquinone/menaquinone biosynthesis C-methylase UbiE